jgi:NADP-dependent aldehyde dehydrogenase
VVKAHPAHPRLSARLAEIAGGAMAGAGVTTGPFGIVHGFDAGTRLVSHPAVRAVGFTGSLAGGLALWRLAASRPEVIPVYAEMGTVNTVVVTPSVAAERPAEIAAGFVGSFTLGMGQFCTKPGLLLAPAGSGLAEETGRALAAAAPDGWLLTEAIADAYHSGLDRLASAGGRVAAQLPGSLAAGVHAAGEDDPQLAGLVATLSRRCGRVVVNGWPTGIALGWAQQHGGPWPATSAPWVSSVGAAALSRWVRPVAFQDVPAAALPAALRDDNPWRVPRRVDGVAA